MHQDYKTSELPSRQEGVVIFPMEKHSANYGDFGNGAKSKTSKNSIEFLKIYSSVILSIENILPSQFQQAFKM